MLKLGLVLFAALLLVSNAKAAASPDAVSGPLYCTATGGVLQTRIPTFNTNGGTQFPLANPRQFCQYLSKDGSTQIDVLLTTLVTTKPTLAALAYYAKVKFDGSNCHGGPGSCYCSQLGGTDSFGGINLSGGGWVLSTDTTDVLDMCIFPDLSSIDAYGLFYHSASIIRGQNLKHLLRYADPYGK